MKCFYSWIDEEREALRYPDSNKLELWLQREWALISICKFPKGFISIGYVGVGFICLGVASCGVFCLDWLCAMGVFGAAQLLTISVLLGAAQLICISTFVALAQLVAFGMQATAQLLAFPVLTSEMSTSLGLDDWRIDYSFLPDEWYFGIFTVVVWLLCALIIHFTVKYQASNISAETPWTEAHRKLIDAMPTFDEGPRNGPYRDYDRAPPSYEESADNYEIVNDRPQDLHRLDNVSPKCCETSPRALLYRYTTPIVIWLSTCVVCGVVILYKEGM